ncbi:cell division protein FtsQ/DivIB [Streptomyces pactum]|uniref:cell division protein FtsQ/DivIB n=1 Tax=Streptomyces pactum TaxID=68249 RepID=UPI00370284D7
MAGPRTAERNGRRAPVARPAPPGPRRRRLRRPDRRTVVLALVAAVLLGGAGTWVVYGSGWLRAERVTVTGTRALTPAAVREAAEVPLDTPMASVDTGAVADRLRSRLPRVAEVDVVRSWPHTIRLEVTERKAVAVIRSGRRYTEVDREGVRFATSAKAPAGVPVLALDTGAATPSTRRFGADRLRREGVRVAVALPAPVRRDARVVRVRSYDSITVELAGDRTVMWGSGERGAAKARALTALLKAVPEGRHFDVSAPSAPAVADS